MRTGVLSGARAFVIGAIAAAVVIVGAGYGYAAITAADQVYTGCLQNGSITNVAISVVPTKACSKSASQISWNQQGPVGESVVSAAEPAGSNCANGGSKFTSVSGVTYACSGAKGDKGEDGLLGSLDSVSGLSCTRNNHDGKASVSYDDDGYAHTACVIGDATSEDLPSSFANSRNLGTLNCGQRILSNTLSTVPTGTSDWLKVTFTGCTLHVSFSGSSGTDVVFDLVDASGNTIQSRLRTTTLTTTGTYYLRVYGLNANWQYVLDLNAS